MSIIFESIKELIALGEVVISAHGYEELIQDKILSLDILNSIASAKVIEEYPEFGRGPTVIVLQIDPKGNPIHVVLGIPAGKMSPAVLVTAYRPDPAPWSDDFMKRII